MRSVRRLVVIALLGFLPSAATLAAGPVDFEIGLAYWLSEAEETGEEAVDTEDLGGWVELGVSRWGFALSYWQLSPDEGGDHEFTSLDVKYRVFEPSEGNYIALGAGGERVGVSGGGFSDDFTTARVLVEGGFSIKIVKVVGRYAYLPSLGDLSAGAITLEGDTGYEAEAMVSVHPLPFFYIHAGYRLHSLDFDVAGVGTVTQEAKGPFAGVGFKF